MKLRIAILVTFAIGVILCCAGLGVISAVSCSSGGGTSAPSVTAIIPSSGASDVAINGSISATFDVAMDSSSLTDSTFVVKIGEISVSGDIALSSDGLTATFTPEGGVLALGTTYTATITTGIKDANGNAIAADYPWSFSTKSGAWSAVTTTSAPAGRYSATAVWADTQMIVWGGTLSNYAGLNTGAVFQ